jgi:hypothetical protein
MTRVNVQAPEAGFPELLDRVKQSEEVVMIKRLKGQLDAQAQGETAALVTADEALAAYDVPIMPVVG